MNLGLSRLRLLWRLLLLIAYTLLMVVWFSAERLLQRPDYQRLPHRFHRGCCRIFGYTIHQFGEPLQDPGTLFVANHISYSDIFVMGGRMPGYFIAKSEVAGWPVLGWLARFQNTLFVERRGAKAAGQIKQMQGHLAEGDSLILFPEGTSTDGDAVLPFKSSLFKACEISEHTVLIQPVTIAYTRYRGQPMSRAERDLYAWYGTMPFASHFIDMLSAKGCEVELRFHPAVKASDFESRKELAKHCQRMVAEGLTAAQPGETIDERNSDKREADGQPGKQGDDLAA